MKRLIILLFMMIMLSTIVTAGLTQEVLRDLDTSLTPNIGTAWDIGMTFDLVNLTGGCTYEISSVKRVASPQWTGDIWILSNSSGQMATKADAGEITTFQDNITGNWEVVAGETYTLMLWGLGGDNIYEYVTGGLYPHTQPHINFSDRCADNGVALAVATCAQGGYTDRYAPIRIIYLNESCVDPETTTTDIVFPLTLNQYTTNLTNKYQFNVTGTTLTEANCTLNWNGTAQETLYNVPANTTYTFNLTKYYNLEGNFTTNVTCVGDNDRSGSTQNWQVFWNTTYPISVNWEGQEPLNNSINTNTTLLHYFNFTGELIDTANCTFYWNNTETESQHDLIANNTYNFSITKSPVLIENISSYIECNSSTWTKANSTSKYVLWNLSQSVITNLSTTPIVYAGSFDVNVSITGNWVETVNCSMIDNVSWVTCLPSTTEVTTSTSFSCTSDGTVGNVNVYAQCSSASFPLLNSTAYTYTYFNYVSLIADSIINLPFNNTILDYSFNEIATWMQNDGVASTPNYGSGWNGLPNNALSTNLTDYLLFNGSEIAYSAINSMVFWMKPDTTFDTDSGILVNSKFGNVIYDSTTTLLSYTINNGGSPETITYENNLTNSYNFISVVCDNDIGQMFLYINGSLVNSTSSIACTESS